LVRIEIEGLEIGVQELLIGAEDRQIGTDGAIADRGRRRAA
jgi:hypothetical protein